MSQIKLWGSVVLLAMVAGVLYGSYYYGYTEAEEAAKITKLAELEKAQEENRKLNVKLHDAALALAEKKIQVVYRDKIITKEVIEYVQDDSRTVCNFDDEWMRIRQGILNNADTRE